eukprot:175971-Rhodomonas_salina.3
MLAAYALAMPCPVLTQLTCDQALFARETDIADWKVASPLSCYVCAMRCPVSAYAMSGTD